MIDSSSRKRSGRSESLETRARLDELIAEAEGAAGTAPYTSDATPDERTTDQPETDAGPERLTGGRFGRLVQRWVPTSVVGRVSRADGRVGRMLAVVTALVSVSVTGFVLLGTEPTVRRPVPRPSLPVVASAVSRTTTSTSAADDTVVISVVGHVATPGLVTLPADARVADALRAAGGVTQHTDRRSVNLARHVVDGEQLYVGIPMPAGASQPPARDARASSGVRTVVNLNTAGMAQLETLPGVGEVTARRIIEWRREHDGFGTVEQLRQVDGIGDKTLADLRDLVTVG